VQLVRQDLEGQALQLPVSTDSREQNCMVLTDRKEMTIPSNLEPPNQNHPRPVNQKPVNQKPVNQKAKNQKSDMSAAGRSWNLRKAKAKSQNTTNMNNISWSVYNPETKQEWNFPADITFTKFWNDIGAMAGEIWWYQGFKMDKEAALSSKDEFDKLLQIALSGQEQSFGSLRIWKASDDDFLSS
jgi:hypothetical protein